MIGRWKRVYSRTDHAVHWAPCVPAEAWMVDRVTLCLPRGMRRAWFDNVTTAPVSCVRCRMLMIGRGGGERD